MTRFKCSACSDTRKVADVFQYLRPCSRCDAEGFNAWTAAQKAPPVPSLEARATEREK